MNLRDRHRFSRYEYAEDRFSFPLWVKTNGPCRKSYWRLNNEKQELVIELSGGDRRMCYALSFFELQSSSDGWRRVIARALRLTRRTLRQSKSAV